MATEQEEEARSALSEPDKHHHLIQNFHYVMGESSCTLTVLDVADALQAGFACVSGGRARNGAPLFTFPDSQALPDLTDDEYKNLVTYLASIPPMHDVDMGFVVIIDRRKDKWAAVKTLLQRIAGYFPGLIQQVLVLRPSGFLQRTFTDMGFKFVKDDFKFKILMCSSLGELHEAVAVDQLTPDLGGELPYDHQEWVQHRAAIEKFSANTSQIGDTLRTLCRRLQETEFPNDVEQTQSLIDNHESSRSGVKNDLSMTLTHGETLLSCFKTVRQEGQVIEVPSLELPCHKITHVTAVERLLVQLEETERNFDEFWAHHERKLHQCLQLRGFEEDFRLYQFAVECHCAALRALSDIGDSPQKVELLIMELQQLEEQSKDDVTRAEEVKVEGDNFIDEDHYAVDCIRPKCIELQRICEQYKELLRTRRELLSRSKDLQDRVDRANRWCTRGVDLLASQQIERCNTEQGAFVALRDVDAFLHTASDIKLNDPKEFKVMFDSILTPDTKALVQSVVQRMEDVHGMCERRRQSLCKLVERPPRPVQTVLPEPVSRPDHHANPHDRAAAGRPGDDDWNNRDVVRRRRPGRNGALERTKAKANVEVLRPENDVTRQTLLDSGSDDADDDVRDYDTLKAKQRRKKNLQRHVIKEILDTERLYVSEVHSILEGYAWELSNPSMQHLIPQELHAAPGVLFGNLEQIYNFHSNVFLKDLESCRKHPTWVGECFIRRKEEFQMYSEYCQNKLRSDVLRQQIGDSNPFFKECQLRLGHKLPLGAYLLKPVQRITRYQLLLKEMMKYVPEGDKAASSLLTAYETVLEVLKYVNDVMHQVAITGYDGLLGAAGRLLMQGSFHVWTCHKREKLRDLLNKPTQRHVFLYEKIVMFCKKRDDPTNAEKASYIYKNSLEMAQVGLTENVKGDRRKLEIWLHGRSEVYMIQAPTAQVKDLWVVEIKKVLQTQFDRIKEGATKQKALRAASSMPESRYIPSQGKAASEPTDSVRVHPLVARSYGSDAGPHSESSECLDEDQGWFSDGSSGERGASPTGAGEAESQDLECSQRYIALADYEAADAGEASLREGDMVELRRLGGQGWWYVHNLTSGLDGWTPANYLDCAKRCSTYSTQSTVSSGSTDSGRRGDGCVTMTTSSPVSTSSGYVSMETSISSQSTSTGSDVSTKQAFTRYTVHRTSRVLKRAQSETVHKVSSHSKNVVISETLV